MIEIEYKDRIAPALRVVAEKMDGPEQAKMFNAMGFEVQRVTSEHLLKIGLTRHVTADRLGGKRTGFWSRASENVSLISDAASATVTIPHPGIRRAVQDVVIEPTTTKFLAIPIHAIAYGRRCAELWDELHLFVVKGKNIVAMKNADGSILPLFALCRRVVQKQDRTLLPDDEELSRAAALGAENQIKSWFREVGIKS